MENFDYLRFTREILVNNNSENFDVEITVNEIILGNSKIDIINGYDNIAYTTLKLKSDFYTIMVFKSNFKYFQNIEVGFTFKAVIKLWKNNTYNFVRLIEDHPKLLLAKKEHKNGNFSKSKVYYEEYFKTCIFSINETFPLGIYTDSKMYFETLISHFKLNISETNPYYEKFEQTLEKCYYLIADNTYSLKEDVELINSITYFNPLGFGKYKDEKIINILKADPEYLFSLIIDTDHFCLTEICFILNNFEEVPNYVIALEINCIKLLLEKEYYESRHEIDDYPKHSEDYGGFGSRDEFNFGQAFEGDSDAWNSHYQ